MFMRTIYLSRYPLPNKIQDLNEDDILNHQILLIKFQTQRLYLQKLYIPPADSSSNPELSTLYNDLTNGKNYDERFTG